MRRFRVGLLSDVQYADIPNGQNYQKTRTRFYRGTVTHINQAIERWHANTPSPKVDIIFDLGDSLDGNCYRHGHTDEALRTLEHAFSHSKVPVRHIVGNHELYNIKRKDILDSFLFRDVKETLPSSAIEKGLCYYSMKPLSGFRFLVMDAYEVSVLGLDEDERRFQDAMTLLTTFNKNDDLNDNANMEEPQYVRYNGGVGDEQLRWLTNELEEAKEEKETVIILSHVPLHKVCAIPPTSILWNWNEVSSLVGRYSKVVKLVICGHTHLVKHDFDEYGILHLALPGLIEVPADEIGVGILEISDTEVKIDGHGGLVPEISINLKD